MKISLIVNTYNQPHALAKVLRAVAVQSRSPEELLIADDGSDERTKAVVEEFRSRLKSQVHYVWQPDQGFRKTVILNEAIRRSTGDYLIVLDGDCVPHHQFVADHVRLAETGFWVQGRRCFVGEKFVAAFEAGETPVWLWLLTGRITGVFKGVRLPSPIVRRQMEQQGILGCNMAVWREDLEAINGFDEGYAGWGGEDSDLGTRLYHLGRPRKFVYGHAIVYHLNHPMLSRESSASNFARLAETIRSRKVRCEQGLARHS